MDARTGKRYHKDRMTKDKPTLRDRLIGRRVMMARRRAGLRQMDLGALLGVTYQIVHKYENGLIKVSAARLVDLSEHLGVPIEYFYRDFAPVEILGVPPRRGKGRRDGVLASDPLASRESVQLVMDYHAIPDEAVRHALLMTLRRIAMLAARAGQTEAGQ